MKKLAVISLLLCVIFALTTGCATKNWVRETIAPLQDDIGKNTAAISKNAQAIQANNGLINNTNSKLDALQATHDKDSKQFQQQLAALNARSYRLAKKQVAGVEVQFDTGKWQLTQESIEALGGLASSIKPNSLVEIVVMGHTDATGTEKFNFALSFKRAQQVAAYLAKNSPAKLGQITMSGYGELLPKSGDDLKLNRRVEVAVYEMSIEVVE